MKRRVRFMFKLFQRSKTARYAAVWLTWPPTWLIDKVRGVDPPASLRVGLDWAREDRFPPTIPTSDTPATIRHPREKP